MNIAPQLLTPRVNRLDHIFNLSLPNIAIESNVTGESVDLALQNLHHQIMGMKEKANELPDVLSTHDIHHYSISYALLAAAIIAAVVFFWRRRRRLVARRRQATASGSAPVNRDHHSDECSEVRVRADSQPSAVHFSARSDRKASVGQVFFTNSSAKLYRDSCNSPIPIKHDFEVEKTQM